MKKILCLIVFFSLALDASTAEENANIFGAWTLIPPLIAILLAFITKDTILSLFIGAFSGAYMIAVASNDPFSSCIKAIVSVSERIINSMADSWNAGIMLQVLSIGGIIALMTRMGGMKAVAEFLSKRAKNKSQAQIYTWFMGLFVFFDDYANCLIVGPVMRPVNDLYKVCREKLAFIVDAAAAPVSSLAIISTWVGYEVSVIKESLAIADVTNLNSFEIFLNTIPYLFYNFFMLFFVLMTAVLSREFGPMYKAQCNMNQDVVFDINDQINESVKMKEDIPLQISNALVPLLVLISSVVIGFYVNGLITLEQEALNAGKSGVSFAIHEIFGAANASIVLFQAAIFATIVAIVMGIYKKIFSFTEAIEIWTIGWKDMISTIIILLLAWSLSSVIKELGTSKYLVDLLSDSMPKWILPSIVFVLGSIISFSTGTSYGTMGIIIPLVISLSYGIGILNGIEGDLLNEYMILNVGAALAGSVFGDHCSPISDTTIMSATGASCRHIDHVSTQLLYTLCVGFIAVTLGYLPAGFGAPLSIVLISGLVTTFLLVRFVGKKI